MLQSYRSTVDEWAAILQHGCRHAMWAYWNIFKRKIWIRLCQCPRKSEFSKLHMNKFRFLTIFFLIFERNFDFWTNFRILTKNSIFEQIFEFWQKIRFLNKFSNFNKKFDFWQKFRFLTKVRILTKVSIFDKSFEFWQKFRFLTKVSIFDKSFDFWHKFRFETNI